MRRCEITMYREEELVDKRNAISLPDSAAGTLERQVHKLEVELASGVVCCSSAASNRVSTGTGKWRAWI